MSIKVLNKTDQDLILLYKSTEDQIHLGELYKRYMHLVYGTCLKYAQDEDQAKDYVMMIYEKLTIDLLKHEVSHFKSWLFMLSKNLCLMEIRKQKTRHKHEDRFGKENIHFMESSEEKHLNSESPKEGSLKHLEDCIQTLKEEQLNCIKMFYLEEKCYDEVAKATGYLLKKVKSYIQNGKRNLKICMEKKHAGEFE